MKRTWPISLLAIALFLQPLGAQTKSNSAVKPVDRQDAGWKKRHESFVERTKKGDVDVLFVGDSITQGWEGAGRQVWQERFAKWKPANLGISGDRTEHVLWRITEGKELNGIDPKVIVMMIGTNNIGSNTPDQIAAGIKAILDEFHKQKPHAKVLLLGVFPRSAKPGRQLKDVKVVPAAELHPDVKAINERIAKFADGKTVFYLDIGGKFLDDTGGLAKAVMPDFLHLTSGAYKSWADAITPKVEELAK